MLFYHCSLYLIIYLLHLKHIIKEGKKISAYIYWANWTINNLNKNISILVYKIQKINYFAFW